METDRDNRTLQIPGSEVTEPHVFGRREESGESHASDAGRGDDARIAHQRVQGAPGAAGRGRSAPHSLGESRHHDEQRPPGHLPPADRFRRRHLVRQPVRGTGQERQEHDCRGERREMHAPERDRDDDSRDVR